MSSAKFQPASGASNQLNDVFEEDPGVKGKAIQIEGTTAPTKAEAEKYVFTGVNPGKAYIHPPDKLINGRVMYRVKFVGYMYVKEPRGSAVAKDAIDKLQAVAAVTKANTGAELKEVTLSVSIRSLMCVDPESKKMLHQHPLSVISFSADDKRGKGNMFAYIARSKTPEKPHICYVYECQGSQAAEITSTVGQAFELAYKHFLKTKKAQEDFKQLKEKLKTCSPEEKEDILKKIAKIEEQKERAAKRRAEAEKKKKAQESAAPTAPVASTPEQKPPPSNTSATAQSVTSTSEQATEPPPSESKPKEAEEQKEKKLPKQDSFTTKWESITTAFEPLKMEETISEEVQTPKEKSKPDTSDLDEAISDLSSQIEEYQEAFSWPKGKKVPENVSELEPPSMPTAQIEYDPSVDKAGEKMKEISIEDFEMPANVVMGEFVKADGSKSSMPRKGSVKAAASSWMEKHAS